jgi:hypothetical protein
LSGPTSQMYWLLWTCHGTSHVVQGRDVPAVHCPAASVAVHCPCCFRRCCCLLLVGTVCLHVLVVTVFPFAFVSVPRPLSPPQLRVQPHSTESGVLPPVQCYGHPTGRGGAHAGSALLPPRGVRWCVQLLWLRLQFQALCTPTKAREGGTRGGPSLLLLPLTATAAP